MRIFVIRSSARAYKPFAYKICTCKHKEIEHWWWKTTMCAVSGCKCNAFEDKVSA